MKILRHPALVATVLVHAVSPLQAYTGNSPASSAGSPNGASAEPLVRRQTLTSEVVTGSASNGTQEGNGLALRFSDRLGTDIRSVEYRRQSRFNETGQQLSFQDTRSLGPSRSLTLAANVADSFLFAKWGLTGLIEQRWDNRLTDATRFGLSHQQMRGSQAQTALLIEQTGTTDWGLLWQFGRQMGRASPGDRSFSANHVGLQYVGVPRWRGLLRKQWANEAYQALSETDERFDFTSRGTRIGISHEALPAVWVQLFHDRYSTPFYDRRQNGIQLETSW